jgi:FdhD protein
MSKTPPATAEAGHRLPVQDFPALQWRGGAFTRGPRVLPAETPVALVHDASTTAIMMASPQHIEDLALGFAFTEGVITTASQVQSLEIVESRQGVEARMWLTPDRSARLADRRRTLVGPTGCGLCGIESLGQAVRDLPEAPAGPRLSPRDVLRAAAAITEAQALGRTTRATHAAAFWTSGLGLVAAREDVGRHNALDKLVGVLLREQADVSAGAVVLTSRVSIEMIQKSAMIGAPVIVAVSAPTTLAVEAAERCGMTLIGIARSDGFEVFTGANRIGEHD